MPGFPEGGGPIRDDGGNENPAQSGTRSSGRWGLNRDALELLLEKFGDDPSEAALEYENFHARLTRFFDWRGCQPPEEFADEVMDRVAHKLEKSQRIEWEESGPLSYLLGIAKNVAKEVYRSDQAERAALRKFSREPPLSREREENDPRLSFLAGCMAELREGDRELLLEYYQGELRGKIENRNRLAEERGLTINALRVKAHRLRQRLEKCIRSKMSAGGETKVGKSP